MPRRNPTTPMGKETRIALKASFIIKMPPTRPVGFGATEFQSFGLTDGGFAGGVTGLRRKKEKKLIGCDTALAAFSKAML